MNSFGLSVEVGKVFVILAFSAFALTSLDTATRIGRYIFQEFFDEASEGTKKIGQNIYVSTIVTVAASCAILVYGYSKIWPIFGSANQLLAALALLALTSWFVSMGKKTSMVLVPMILMFCVTLSALALLIKQYIFGATTNFILGIFAIVLFVLAIILLIEAYNVFIKKKIVKK
ncbi:hypothetical protein SDC9_131981 [bioreactor metagenome]